MTGDGQATGGLVLLLATVAAGVGIQIGALPREAQAVRRTPQTVPQASIPAGTSSIEGPAVPAHAQAASVSTIRPHGGAAQARSSTSSQAHSGGRLHGVARTSDRSSGSRVAHGSIRNDGRVTASARIRTVPPAKVRTPADGGRAAGAMAAMDGLDAAEDASRATLGGKSDAPTAPDATAQTATVVPGGGDAQLVVLGPATARGGETITYMLSLEQVPGVGHAPLRVTYDPDVLRFVEAREGSFLSSDGAITHFLATDRPDDGIVEITLSRLAPARDISGGGVVATVTFLARAPGESPVLVHGSALLDAEGRLVPFTGQDAEVAVEP